jgi:glyceraldehyde-3-phosphate dehydrogenase (ferredoxin)
MDCLDEGLITPGDVGVTAMPRWQVEEFDVVADSMHNAELGVAMLDQIVASEGKINLSLGARKFSRGLSREKDNRIMDRLVVLAFARRGWMVPNQYWTPGAFAPMAIMGKYYMYYGKDFLPPRELGRQNAHRMLKELVLDNMGFCRFHRAWAEEMLPEMVDRVFGCRDEFITSIHLTASRITSRNASVFWESERNMDMIYHFLKKKQASDSNDTDSNDNNDLNHWVAFFERDKRSAAYEFWYEMHKGIHEVLREFS